MPSPSGERHGAEDQVRLQIRFAGASYFVPYDLWSKLSSTIKSLAEDPSATLSNLCLDVPQRSFVPYEAMQWLVEFVDAAVGGPEMAEVSDDDHPQMLITSHHSATLLRICGSLASLDAHCRIASMLFLSHALGMHVVSRILRSHLVKYVNDGIVLKKLAASSLVERTMKTYAALSD
jgi:hypothetical protein